MDIAKNSCSMRKFHAIKVFFMQIFDTSLRDVAIETADFLRVDKM